MAEHDFGSVERRDTDSVKWNLYAADVTPAWIAEADFKPPQAVIDALVARAQHGMFGYTAAIGHASAPGALWELPRVAEIIVDRLWRRYQWRVTPDELVYLPGVVAGFNVACRIAGHPGDAVMMHAPCYGPITKGPLNQGRRAVYTQLKLTQDVTGSLYYVHDDADMHANLDATTAMFLLCNPHNPTGRALQRAELEQIAERCVANNMLICSDEIHAEILLGDTVHIPIATLSPEVARRTITLMSPSKSFNIPGLGFSVAIIQDPQVRATYTAAMQGLVASPQIFGYVGAMAAYQHGDDWLNQVNAYYLANRDFTLDYLRMHMPQLRSTRAEATYLAWIDCRQAELPLPAKAFFETHAKVALADGAGFGESGAGFVRLTMATQRQRLEQILHAMALALKRFG